MRIIKTVSKHSGNWEGTKMIRIYEKYRERFQRSHKKIRHAYRHNDTGEPPIVIVDVNSYLSGENPEAIPDDYYGNFNSMADFQIKKIINHLEKYDDDYIPHLFPWFGTGVIPSALGCNIVFQDKMDPAVEGTVIKIPEDIRGLEMPDPYKDGLMPKVLKCIDFMREYSDLPVSFTDCQGPLNIALCLCGVENLFIWMYEYPEYVHEIMDFCTEVLIQWVKVQKRHAGQALNTDAFPHSIVLPEGFGGVCISDDDCTVISPRLYEEFVVPYNSRVFKAFGGGTLHFCGSAEHQLENFLKIEGLTGINNFCMNNFRQIVKMQELFEDKLTIMVCDFAPLNIEEYYRELIDCVKFKGIVFAPFVIPGFALDNGKYETVSRDRDELTRQIYDNLKRLIREKNY